MQRPDPAMSTSASEMVYRIPDQIIIANARKFSNRRIQEDTNNSNHPTLKKAQIMEQGTYRAACEDLDLSQRHETREVGESNNANR